MKRQVKHTAQEQEQEQISDIKSGTTSAQEFASAEELIRHDADQTVVPPAIAERLARSIEELPKPAPSWWRRLLDR
ncbi:MAG: hypothetical protein KIS67_14645 [Verrucomicrobiae bacterium]|nr:hypothetical protein [Verrucomicrobiae bacterium]